MNSRFDQQRISVQASISQSCSIIQLIYDVKSNGVMLASNTRLFWKNTQMRSAWFRMCYCVMRVVLFLLSNHLSQYSACWVKFVAALLRRRFSRLESPLKSFGKSFFTFLSSQATSPLSGLSVDWPSYPVPRPGRCHRDATSAIYAENFSRDDIKRIATFLRCNDNVDQDVTKGLVAVGRA